MSPRPAPAWVADLMQRAAPMLHDAIAHAQTAYPGEDLVAVVADTALRAQPRAEHAAVPAFVQVRGGAVTTFAAVIPRALALELVASLGDVAVDALREGAPPAPYAALWPTIHLAVYSAQRHRLEICRFVTTVPAARGQA